MSDFSELNRPAMKPSKKSRIRRLYNWTEGSVEMSRINLILVFLIGMAAGQIVDNFGEGFRKGWNHTAVEAQR